MQPLKAIHQFQNYKCILDNRVVHSLKQARYNQAELDVKFHRQSRGCSSKRNFEIGHEPI